MITEQDVCSIVVPEVTDTYEPVPNKFIIELIKETANDYGYSIINKEYKISNKGGISLGIYNFEGDDMDMGLQMAFLNSYDKSRSVTLATGAVVFVCTNGMVNAEEVFKRKHTGSVRDEIMVSIENQITKMRDNYDDLVSFKETLKSITIPISETYKISGDLFFNTDIISTRNLSDLKKQLSDRNFGIINERITLWQIYNWITELLKKESALTHINSHIKLHKYFNTLLPYYV